MHATYTFPGEKIIICDCKSRNSYNTYGAANGAIVFGREGSVFLTGSGYKLYDREGKLLKEEDSNANTVDLHFNNFLDSIRGKSTVNSSVVEAEKSTLMCHLANISYRIGNDLKVNSKNGHALDKKALKFWDREYEPGWELKI
jgi:hypothetical protein